jgi:hypothetical protein
MPNKTWFTKMRQAKINLEVAKATYDLLAEQARDLAIGAHTCATKDGGVEVLVTRNRVLDKGKAVENWGEEVLTPQFDLAKAKAVIPADQLDALYVDRDPRITVTVK